MSLDLQHFLLPPTMAADESECATLHVLTPTGEDIEVSLARNGSRSIVHLTTAKGTQAGKCEAEWCNKKDHERKGFNYIKKGQRFKYS